MTSASDTSLRRGTTWVGVASAISGGLDLVSTLVCLWLWVSPAEFGIATIACSLFPVLERVAALGLNSAAVRRGDGHPAALSSMFWLSVAASVTVFAITVATAPLIGDAFDHPVVGAMVSVFAITLVTRNAQLVPEALLRRQLRFRTLSTVRTSATFADTIAKLSCAYLGAHGHPELRVWCFVIGPMTNSLVGSIGMQIARPWRPRFAFDLHEAIAAGRFGIQLSIADLLYFVYTSADYIVIGRVFGDVAVAAYRLAYEMVLDVVRLVSMVTAEVAFPAFAQLADDHARAGELLVRFTRQNVILIAPVLIVIAVAADDLLAILYPPLGPQAVTAARILCVVGALRAASFVLPPMLAGLGHPRDALIYSVVAAIVCPAGFVFAASQFPELGYLSVAWAWVATYPIAFAILLWIALARTGVTAFTYARALAPTLGWAAPTAALALGVRIVMPASPWLRTAAVIATTAASYGAFLVARRYRPAAPTMRA